MIFKGYADTEACEHVCELCAGPTDDLYPLDDDSTDSPANCSTCGRPLDCYLTAEGEQYVLTCVRELLRKGRAYRETVTGGSPSYYVGSNRAAVVRDWCQGYQYWGLDTRDKRTIDLFLTWTN